MSRKQDIAGLLKRYQFIDLSIAVGTDPELREQHLRDYVDRPKTKFPTYEPFRSAIGGIYGVSLGLDPTEPQPWPKIETAVRVKCAGENEDMNLDAAKALFSLVREDELAKAYHHPERTLFLGPDRSCRFRLGHYLIRGDKAVFQFPFPRSSRLSERQLLVMMSLISLAYARDDFSEAHVEIADLTRENGHYYEKGKKYHLPRSPRVVSMPPTGPLHREQLEADIQDVYRILLKLADE